MKSKPIAYHPDAQLEIAEASAWYQWHEAGLGERFLEELTGAERFVQRQPSLGTPHSFGSRTRRMHIFPYILIYTEEPKRIWVLAVAHCSREPDYWASRLVD